MIFADVRRVPSLGISLRVVDGIPLWARQVAVIVVVSAVLLGGYSRHHGEHSRSMIFQLQPEHEFRQGSALFRGFPVGARHGCALDRCVLVGCLHDQMSTRNAGPEEQPSMPQLNPAKCKNKPATKKEIPVAVLGMGFYPSASLIMRWAFAMTAMSGRVANSQTLLYTESGDVS
ncbi:hypothetical protein IF1G_08359 [Cordyceps javanica]|uniref:Uncharacterized protein n=1 Tax=Cordyceps javanica TaxID=43265 RepID=A0A545UUC0_9HYPO|nr:hypothetical protein IF1G_08359 [Cordyceps javanica]